jgi:hypothetical protein
MNVAERMYYIIFLIIHIFEPNYIHRHMNLWFVVY